MTPSTTLNEPGKTFARQPERSLPLNKFSHSAADTFVGMKDRNIKPMRMARFCMAAIKASEGREGKSERDSRSATFMPLQREIDWVFDFGSAEANSGLP